MSKYLTEFNLIIEFPPISKQSGQVFFLALLKTINCVLRTDNSKLIDRNQEFILLKASARFTYINSGDLL